METKTPLFETFVANTECAIEHNEKLLIIRRPDHVHGGGLLAFPGGKVDYNDGTVNAKNATSHQDILINAIKREVQEEVGLILLDPLRYVTSAYFVVPKNKVHVINVIFYCKLESTQPNLNVSQREVPEYYWLTYDEILGHDKTPPWMKNYVSEILKHKEQR